MLFQVCDKYNVLVSAIVIMIDFALYRFVKMLSLMYSCYKCLRICDCVVNYQNICKNTLYN